MSPWEETHVLRLTTYTDNAHLKLFVIERQKVSCTSQPLIFNPNEKLHDLTRFHMLDRVMEDAKREFVIN